MPIYIFIFGLIIGSFLNVLGLRLNSGVGFGGRSFCLSCSKDLKWWELVPALSFFLLRGRCSSCKSRISWQYPLVEMWTGFIFLSLFFIFGLTANLLLSATVFSLYVAIFIYDSRHKIIPNKLVYPAILVALIFRIIVGGQMIDFLSGPIMFAFFGFIWLVSNGRAMGFGDAKLALSIGFMLGGAMGLSAFVLSFWIGSVVAIFLMIASRIMNTRNRAFLKRAKRLTMKSEIPFAPFLIIGAWASLIFHLDLLHVLAFI